MIKKLFLTLTILIFVISGFASDIDLIRSAHIGSGSVNAVDGIGNIVYAGVNGSLNVYNVYRRDYPQLMHSMEGIFSEIRDIIVSEPDNRLYVLSAKDGLYIMDISEPYHPSVIGHIGSQEEVLNTMDLAETGLLYIGGENFISEVNVDSPSEPQVTKSINLPGAPAKIDYHRNRLYIALGDHGLVLLGTTHEENFVYMGMQPGVYTMVKAYAENVLYGRLDKPKEGEPRMFNHLFSFPFSHPVTAQVEDNLIYSGGLHNFAIYKMKDNQTQPKMIWNLPNLPTLDCVLKEDYIYLANSWKGLSVYDVANPFEPEQIGNVSTFGTPDNFVMHDDVLYVLSRHSGIARFDITEPTEPIFLDAISIDDFKAFWDVAEYNGLIYVLGARNSDADNVFIKKIDPVRNTILAEYPVGRVERPDHISGLEFNDDILAVNLGYDGIKIMRIEDTDLETLYSINYGEAQFYDIEFDGDFMYASDFHGSYYIYRATSDVMPEFIGKIDVSDDGGNGIEPYGGYLLAADATGGLTVIDVSNPKEPELVSNYPTKWAMDVQVQDDYAFVADAQGQCKVFDLTEIDNGELALVDSLPHAGYWTHVMLDGDMLYGLDMYHGIYMYNITSEEVVAKANTGNPVLPRKSQIARNYPNPFNSKTSIYVSVNRKDMVDVTIYDVSGRKVETLIRDELPAGDYTLTWEPTSQPSGVYLVVMNVGQETFKHKIELIE
ncbi:MAG: T9SS type A sorting domain-containing protein [Candidatus Zixiibacteriota bacterium]